MNILAKVHSSVSVMPGPPEEWSKVKQPTSALPVRHLNNIKSRNVFNIIFLFLDIRKQFITSPTSLRVEVGTRAELFCTAPTGYPEPKISWYKNNVLIKDPNEHGVSISLDGTLTIAETNLQV